MKLDDRWKDSLQRDCFEIQNLYDGWKKSKENKMYALLMIFSFGVSLLIAIFMAGLPLDNFKVILIWIGFLICAWIAYKEARASKKIYKRIESIEKRWGDFGVTIKTFDLSTRKMNAFFGGRINPFVYFEKKRFDPFCEDSYGEPDSE